MNFASALVFIAATVGTAVGDVRVETAPFE